MGLFLFSACVGKEMNEVVEEDTTPVLDNFIFHGIEAGKTISLQGKNLDKLVWTSSDPFCATADGGKIHSNHVGFANIYTTGADRFALWVLVSPKYNDYDLPFVCEPSGQTALNYYWPSPGQSLWNKGPATIAAYENTREKDRRSTNSLVVYKTGNIKSPYVCYFFDNGALTQAGTIISLSDLSALPFFLKERYDVISVDTINYSAYFEHKHFEEGSIDYIGGLQYFPQLGGLLLALMPPTITKGSNIDMVMEQMAKELTKII